MRTVLIFAHECAPYNRPESTVGAQRPAQFAKYLPLYGWRAIVLCCHRDERGVEGGEAIAGRVRRALEEGRPDESVVIATPSLAYDGGIDRVWRKLLPGSNRRSVIRDVLRKPLTAAKLRTGDYSQAWQPVAREAAEMVCRLTRVDACIGEHSPDAGMLLARWFSDAKGVPWIADFRDPILQPLSPALRLLYAPIARSVLRSASAIVNVTPYWSELDARMFRRPVATIPNGFDEDEFSRLDVRPTEKFTIVNVGNVWEEMRPSLFFEGLARLRAMLGPERFARSVRFVYRGLAHASMTDMAHASGVADVVDIGPFEPRAGVLRLLQEANALLLFSIVPDPQRDIYLQRGVYPGKVFEYFGARRPILCVPGDGAQLDELLTRTRTGSVCPTPESIGDWLAPRVTEWESGLTPSFRPDETELARYTRNNVARQLGAVLNSVIANSKAVDATETSSRVLANGRLSQGIVGSPTIRRLLVVAWEYPGVHSQRGAALARRIGQLCRGFAARGWQVDVLHRQQDRVEAVVCDQVRLHSIAGPMIDPSEASTIVRRLATGWFALRSGDRSGRWARNAMDALSSFDSAPPALIIGCFTPRGPLAVARRAAKRWGVPWLADLQDPILEGASRSIQPMVASWMRRTLAGASTVVHVSPEWAQADAAILERSVVSLRHAIPTVPAGFTGSHRGSPDEFVLLHAGSVNEHQSPSHLMQAIRCLNSGLGKRVVLEVAGRDSVRDAFLRAAPDQDTRAAVKALGWLDSKALYSAMARADCLVVLPTMDPGRLHVPSKLFEYLATDRPVLVAGPDSGGMSSLYVEWGHRDVTQKNADAITMALQRAREGDSAELLSRSSCEHSPLIEDELVDAYVEIAEREIARSIGLERAHAAV